LIIDDDENHHDIEVELVDGNVKRSSSVVAEVSLSSDCSLPDKTHFVFPAIAVATIV